ncbi:MAG TPA: lysyl oxidase family protein [Actinomycetes bacterium]|nr:lysyl oxidase family protein [Actinomycetes bacterium]
MRSGPLVAAGLATTAAALVSVLAAGALPVANAGTTPPLDDPVPTDTSTSPTDPPPDPATPTPTPTTPTPPPPTPTPTVTPVTLLMPDLVAIPAADPELKVRKKTGVRVLRFESSLGNVGSGPLEVRPNQSQPCPPGQQNSTQLVYSDTNLNGVYNRLQDVSVWRHRAGCMLYHPTHDHWHFKASAQYSLVDPRNGDAVVSYRRKVSFCLRDTARVPAEYGTWTYREVYGTCTKRSPQGISVGWMDIYQSFLAGQRLVLPEGLADGLYCLQTVVDPVNQLVEGNDLNNSSVAAFGIRGEKVHLRPPERCL